MPQTILHTACLIGIDIGTSSAKAVIVDEKGKLLAWAAHEYPIDIPQPGWAEQDPQRWVEGAVEAVRQVVRDSSILPQQVLAIGLTGQMHSLVCLDKDGQPLRPAIIWADQRSGDQVRGLTERIGLQQLAEWTGNPIATGFMLPSWIWLTEHEPDHAAKTRWLVLPKDYVRYCLTGEMGTEPSDASSTLLFDTHQRRWSQPILDLAGISVDHLPVIAESAAVAGTLLPAIADRCGLPAGIPIVYGGSDQAVQALAQGVIDPGRVSCTIGTGGQLFSPLATPVHDPSLRLHLFCHVLPQVWHLEAAILSAGLSLRWLRDQVWPGSQYESLAEEASKAQAAAQGLFFTPYLAGERTPHMNSTARAAFIGLDLNHGAANMTRAAMEGVVFALREGLDLMEGLGVNIDQIAISGGATRHPLWLHLLADIFQRPVIPSDLQEATGRGAAVLAGIGVRLYSDVRAALTQTSVSVGEAILPDQKQSEMYRSAYERYKQIYSLVRNI